jgi:alkylation response protein AidB-like acyl-CoA dehydrogenase
MGLELSAEQAELKAQLARLLGELSPPAVLRRVAEAGTGWSPELWRALAELGVLGAAIPEVYGGLGLGVTDLCVVAEELGRSVAPTPFFSSIGLAAEAIRLAGDEGQKARWLPKLATGEAIGAFAWEEGTGTPDALQTRLEGGCLTGTKWPVADAGLAHVAVVVCAGPSLALVELGAAGVVLKPLQGFDQLRGHARLTFQQPLAEPLRARDAQDVLTQVMRRAAVIEAFEQIGGAEAAMLMARDYALQRHTFARQLASYQAVKHNLANILVQVELARSNALHAARQLEADAPDAAAAAATARIAATHAYELAARENLQLHGGIGFTWEADCHFHYRRARLLALNLGSSELWEVRLIDALAHLDNQAA